MPQIFPLVVFGSIYESIQYDYVLSVKVWKYVTYERSSHVVVFDLPQSAHFNYASVFIRDGSHAGINDFVEGHIAVVAHAGDVGLPQVMDFLFQAVVRQLGRVSVRELEYEYALVDVCGLL